MANGLGNQEVENQSRGFSSLKEQARLLTADMSSEQFVWKPEVQKWSVGECLEHLNVVGGKLLPAIRQAIDRGHRDGIVAEPPFTYGFISRAFVRGNEPSSRWKMKTFRAYQPAPAAKLEKEPVLKDFMELQDAFIEQVKRSDGLDLRRIRVASPAVRLLRLSLGAWFAATVAHEKRHLKQAHRVTQDPGFPAN